MPPSSTRLDPRRARRLRPTPATPPRRSRTSWGSFAPLSAPTSARCICSSPTASTWSWPPRSACGRSASARVRHAACTRGSSGLVAEQVRPVAVEHAPGASALQVLPRGRRGAVSSRSSACRSSTTACCRACWWCRPLEPRRFSDEEIAALTAAAAQVAPIVSEARTLDQFIAPAQEKLWALARNLWWSWDQDARSLFRDLDPARWRELDHNPIALLSEMPLDAARAARRRAGAAQPHQLRLPPAAGVPRRATRPGARRHAGVLRPARWRTSRPSSGCTSRCRSTPAASACWPATTSRARRTWACRSSASACSTARATSASGSTATAGSSEEYLDIDASQLPMEPAIGAGRRAGHRAASRPAAASIAAKVWRVTVGRCDAAAARLQRRGQLARGPRADRAALRRRRPRAHPPGAAAGRRRRAGAAGAWASRPACCT